MDEIAQRYADAKTCECGALIECLDGGGYTYWVHVKRMRVEYDHAAVPERPSRYDPDFADRLANRAPR